MNSFLCWGVGGTRETIRFGLVSHDYYIGLLSNFHTVTCSKHALYWFIVIFMAPKFSALW